MPTFDITVLLTSLLLLFLISIYNTLIIIKLDIQESKYLQQLSLVQLFFLLYLFTFPSYLMLWIEPQFPCDLNVRFIIVCAAYFALLSNSSNLNWNLNIEKIPHRELLKIFLPTLFINIVIWISMLKPLVLSVDSIEQKPLLFFVSLILIVSCSLILQYLLIYFLQKISLKNLHFLLYFIHIVLIISLLCFIYKEKIDNSFSFFVLLPCIILATYLFFFNLIRKQLSWSLGVVIGIYIIVCLLALVIDNIFHRPNDRNEYFYEYSHYEKEFFETERAKYQTQYWTRIYATPAKICCDDKLTLHIENDFDSKKNKQFLLLKNDTLAFFYYKTIVKNNARRAKIQAITIKYPHFRALYYIEADTLRLKWKEITEE